ncbi:cold-shock protein [Parachryseolinea silvisoli]|jgi:cold shock CspA family protein|uniref:cold-shock protein n=1 Tax=Parachryseolinea silvisoli TaxID=2873601 RepID=UPI002265B75A|nr:cold shock domain-containing protein [Parachryseolinea silvisoli]MCD9016751.1 cold shock domain-containing protein [Parachryseolinea silvisoli]
MAETFSKRENEKKKDQKKKEKEQRKADRKANAKSGASLDDMMAYVDENGNITTVPPDPTRKKAVINENDIVIGSRNIGGQEAAPLRKGRVSYFNTSKGYGFIKDLMTQESIFVHANALSAPIKEGDMVTFETEHSAKGLNAIQVKKN